MDFLVICVLILFIAVLSRLFFKTFLFASIIGIVGYIAVPQDMKNTLDSYVSIKKVEGLLSSGLSSLMGVSKSAAVKIKTETDKL